MPKRQNYKTGSELFIVDNSEEAWKALRYLHDWCQLSKSIDIATGYFEIGSLLALDGEWQKVNKIRILMGDETSKRTKRSFEKGLKEISSRLDESLEKEKSKNHFLSGVPAIVDAIQNGKIECRVYRKNKFHAKAYITHARMDVVGSSALVGSSNFTFPGLTENIELNVQITGGPVAVLQEWYDEHWQDAEDVTPELLQVIERHVREYLPFDVYARSLQQYFLGHEESASEWEKNNSLIFPVLAKYQQDGYNALIKRANNYGGALLCDGVGLGKTFIGLMLIERFAVHERKNVALFVPKAAKADVWERELQKRLPALLKGYGRLKVFSHTDLMRDKIAEELEQVRQQADVIIIDEAHHFRNTGTKGEKEGERRSRYWKLYDIIEDKQLFHLTATPINNSLLDFQHMVELFTRHQSDYFSDAPLGIHSLAGHIRKLEKAIENQISGKDDGEGVDINYSEASEILSADSLFDTLVVQRSRSYVKQSVSRESGGEIMFPAPRAPKVVEYSVKQTYGKLLDMVADAFHKKEPLFSLPIYYPYAFYIGDDDSVNLALEKGRRKQVGSLMCTGFLRRFESQAEGLKRACWNRLWKLLAWLEVHAETENEKTAVEHWKRRNAKLIDYKPQLDLIESEDEDFISPELLDAVEKLDRNEFNIEQIVLGSVRDLEQLSDFLIELEKFKPSQDKKLTELKKLLRSDSVASKHKVIIFTEFSDTARYLYEQLKAEGIEGLAQIDGGYKGNRSTLIRRFAPYYNESTSERLANEGLEEIRVLISTDVLSEGLNLQDGTRLINYDLHWNPVRLMQRIGRVDRRMNPEIEKQIIADHPDQSKLRGTVSYWNFLPPGDLDNLLSLYQKVSHKTLRISKTLGIEGKKLLREDDNFEDLKNFAEQYDGRPTPDEEMHLEFQDLLRNNEGLDGKLIDFPDAIFSGRAHVKSGSQAVFFCYARPARDKPLSKSTGEDCWTTDAGDVKWYLFDLKTENIIEEATQIIEYIRSEPETPRILEIEQTVLSDIRKKIEKHITKTYLRRVQAPVGIKPVLKAWMELN